MPGNISLPLLLVEDDADMAGNITDYLERRGWTVHHAPTGPLALPLVLQQLFAVVVLDRGLPGLDGIQVCQHLRRGLTRDLPVLMLTAADSLTDRLGGFAAGVDDYLVKPFALAELQARLEALVRRTNGSAPAASGELLHCADLTLWPRTREVQRAGQSLNLTRMGFDLLELLLRRSPEVVRREELEQALWGEEPPGSDALRSHLFALRNAVDRPCLPALLHTHRGVGVQLRPPTQPFTQDPA
jgi:DNA-binding response OmpR family regulator